MHNTQKKITSKTSWTDNASLETNKEKMHVNCNNKQFGDLKSTVNYES